MDLFPPASDVLFDEAEARRREAAFEAPDREQHLRLAMEAGQVGTWEWAVNTNEVAWSTGLEAIHGLNPGEFPGTLEGFKADIHPDDMDLVQDAITRTVQEGHDHHVEYRILLPDGSLRWVEGRGRLFRDIDGNPVRVMGVCTDVTTRKMVEQALSNQARVQTALFQLTDRLHRAKSLQEVYDSALDSIVQAVQCDRTSLLLYDDSDVMRFVGWRGLSGAYREAAEGHSPWARDEKDPHPVCHADIEETDLPEYLKKVIRDEGIRSMCFIPLSVDGRIIGKFMTYYEVPHEFSNSEIDLILTISRQLSAGIESKRAEQALTESEQSLRFALEAGRMGTWEWTVGSEKVKWSPGLEMLYGFEPGAFPGTFQAYQSRVHPDDREFLQNSITHNMESGNEHNVEHRIILPGGGVRWMEGRGRVFRDASGNAVRMVGVSSDITDRKRIEHDLVFLANASASLAELVDDKDTLHKLANLAVPEFADWCAVDLLQPDNTLNRVAVAHIDPAKVKMARELQTRFPPDPDAPTGIWNIIRTGKSELFSEITDELIALTITNPEIVEILRELGLRSYMGVPLTVRGKVLGAITFIAAESGRRYSERELSIAEDLALRAAVAIDNGRLYQELREADRRKDTFLATLAHELRNPLAPMRHAVEIMELRDVDPAVLSDARATIYRQLVHMVRLVDDLLDISRISQDKLKLQKTEVEISTIIQQAYESAAPTISAQKQRVEIQLPTEPVLVDADRTRLVQVVSNLLNNASKFAEPDTNILVRAWKEGALAYVSVKDEGIGIAPDMFPQIFEMFAQADHTNLRQQSGLGIGLSLAKRLVELHGGEISVSSDGVGQGSEFTIRLPILGEALEESVTEAVNTPKELPKLKVLVVDDNHDAARMFKTMLAMCGHHTEIAGDGEEAVKSAQEFRPDLILMDLGLPIISGYEAAMQIRQSNWGKEMMLVAVSGWGQDEDRQKSKEAGFNAHLVKPVGFDALDKLLRELLESKG